MNDPSVRYWSQELVALSMKLRRLALTSDDRTELATVATEAAFASVKLAHHLGSPSIEVHYELETDDD